MSLKKYLTVNLLTYCLIFFAPLLALPLKFNQQQVIMFSAATYVIGAGIMIYLSPKLTETPVIERGKNLPFKQVIKIGLIGIILAFFSQTVAGMVEQLFIGATPESENTENIMQMIKMSPIFILTVSIAGPIMEEFIFRRAITGVLSNYITPLLAACFSSFLFAIAHADGHILVYFAMGMALYYLYQLTGNIWTSIITHCCMNTLVIVIQLALI